MVFVDIGIEIAVISLALVLVSRAIRIRFGNEKELNQLQAQVKEKQKRMQELLKKEDEKSKKEAENIQTEMMGSLNKSMSLSMKTMVISMIIFVPALALLGGTYHGMTVVSPLAIPVFHHATGLIPFSVELSDHSNWFSWYFWWSIIGSLVLGFVLKKMKIV